jgi:hypothetical protein
MITWGLKRVSSPQFVPVLFLKFLARSRAIARAKITRAAALRTVIWNFISVRVILPGSHFDDNNCLRKDVILHSNTP